MNNELNHKISGLSSEVMIVEESRSEQQHDQEINILKNMVSQRDNLISKMREDQSRNNNNFGQNTKNDRNH